MKKALFFLPVFLFLSCITINRVPIPPKGTQGVLYYDADQEKYRWLDPADLAPKDPPGAWEAPNPWQWVPIDTMTIYNANTGAPLFFWSNGKFYEPADHSKELESGKRPFGSKQ